MTETPVPTPADNLNAALFAFTACIADAVENVCSWGITIGEQYVPFDPDEEDGCGEGEAYCTQLWVRVAGATPTSLGESFGGNGCAVSMRVDLEVGILRCFDITEEGEAPSASDVHAASIQSMEDMLAIQCAALNCKDTEGRDIWDAIDLGTWSPIGPLGGQHGGVWTFTVEF